MRARIRLGRARALRGAGPAAPALRARIRLGRARALRGAGPAAPALRARIRIGGAVSAPPPRGRAPAAARGRQPPPRRRGSRSAEAFSRLRPAGTRPRARRAAPYINTATRPPSRMLLDVNPFTMMIFNVFITSAVLITLYTCNFYYLALLSARRTGMHATAQVGEPAVTVHLPIYNEKYVASRLIEAVCAMDYPKDRMRIMVLDDSDDGTVQMVEGLVERYRRLGFRIQHVRRGTRDGYKAGALKHAMRTTDTEYVAIFDADFIPPKWFLSRAMPHFAESNIGMVQCRWGHVNENYSTITKAQALSLDFHFLVEQKAKSDSRLFMNFNGTAGIWRRECIEDAGGWHTATLVEDLDLSYRAQMRGWRCLFLKDMVIDAELPVQMNAAKRQQFRWAKGSIQCALKLLVDIVVKRGLAAEAKIQAFVQLTRHIVFPLMLVQFLTLPILLASDVNMHLVSFLPAVTIAIYLAMGPGAYLMVIHRMYGGTWRSKAKILPALLVYSFGMSVNNTVAVFDALVGKKNEFLRTPKYGIVKNTDGWRDKAYNLPFTKTTLLEAFFGVYGVLGVFVAIFSNNAVFAPIIGLQTSGYFFIAYMSLAHSRFKRDGRPPAGHRGREERMADVAYKMAVSGIVALIAFGAFVALDGYAKGVYPLDLARGHLTEIARTTEPLAAASLVQDVRAHLPESGNPVWIFSTSDTDWGIMHAHLDSMAATATGISVSPVDSSAYHTGMSNIKASALELRSSISNATPYMYVNPYTMLFSAMWVAGIVGIFAVLKRRRDQIQRYDAARDA